MNKNRNPVDYKKHGGGVPSPLMDKFQDYIPGKAEGVVQATPKPVEETTDEGSSKPLEEPDGEG